MKKIISWLALVVMGLSVFQVQAQEEADYLINNTDSIINHSDIKELKKISSRRLTKRVIEQYVDYDNITLKITAKLILNNKRYKLHIQYKSIKDSIIWINMNHSTGLPVARFLITKDSLKLIDRMKKKYYKIAYQNMACDTLDYCFDYNTFSAIFLGELINLNPKKRLLGAYLKYKSYKTSDGYIMQNLPKRRLNRIIKKNKIERFFIHKNLIDTAYQLKENVLEDNVHHQNLTIRYDAYDTLNNVPQNIQLQLLNPKDTMIVDMKVKRVKINQDKMKFSFRVPKKYEVIE